MKDYKAPESLKQIITDTMKHFPCCVCGKPSNYFIKPNAYLPTRAYCDKCSSDINSNKDD